MTTESNIIATWGNKGDQLLVKATHWMPLPEPPTEEEDRA